MSETAQGSEKSGFNLHPKIYLAIIVGIIMISGLLGFLYLQKQKFTFQPNLNQTPKPEVAETIDVQPQGSSVKSGGGGPRQASTEAASPTIEKIIKAKVTGISETSLTVQTDNQQLLKIPWDKMSSLTRKELAIGQSITLLMTQDRQNNILSAEVNIP